MNNTDMVILLIGLLAGSIIGLLIGSEIQVSSDRQKVGTYCVLMEISKEKCDILLYGNIR